MLLNKNLKKSFLPVTFYFHKPLNYSWMQKSMVLLFVNKRTYHGLLFLLLQEKHKQELEDMRKAGHEALSIIVDEYKVNIR